MTPRILPVIAILLLGAISPAAAQLSWQHRSTTTGDLEAPTTGGSQQPDSWILDVDQDGLQDFVVCERIVAPSMLWYRRHPGGWDRYVIDATQLHLTAGGSQHDIDGDGDLDLVGVGSYLTNQVWWFENPYPNYDPETPWARHNLKSSGGPTQHDSLFGDFDGDGVDEFVFWNQGGLTFPDNYLFLAEVPANPKTVPDWPRSLIHSGASAAEGLAKADIDGDGVHDIIGGGYWFKRSPDGSFTAMPVYPTRSYSQVAAGQLITGGRPEIVVSSGDTVGPLELYRWDGAAWTAELLLPFDTFNAHSLQVVDFDGDGHLDIFTGEMNLNDQNPTARSWILLGNSLGNFTTVEVYSGFGVHNSKVGDLDGDGDMDILGKPFNWDVPRIDVWLTHGTGLPLDQWQRHLIDTTPWQSDIIYAHDLNGDGRKDLVAGGWWWTNPGPLGDPWTRNTIGAPLNNLAAVHDYNGDGFLDLLGTETKLQFPLSSSDNGHRFHWGMGNGTGGFLIDHIGNAPGATGADFLQGVTGGVFEPGGPFKTVLAWQNGENGNTPVQSVTPPSGDPIVEPWIFAPLHPSSLGEGMSTADIDGDGDADVFQGTKWLRNDGAGVFTQFTANTDILTFGLTDRNRLADVDRDGDLDAIVGFAHFDPAPTTSFVWLEQPDDPTQPWPYHVIGTNVGGGYSVDVADMDLDGDVDVILGEHIGQTRLLIYENLSNGTSWNERVIDTGGAGIDHHLGTRVSDLDGDGDLDIYSIGWANDHVWVYENLGADSVVDLTPPAAPAQLTATPISDREIHLSWAASAAEDIATYRVHRGTTAGFAPSPTNLLATVTNSEFTDSGHSELETFHYLVTATDLSGNVSMATSVSATTLPDTFPPALRRVRALNESTLRLDFTEPIASTSATDMFLFTIPGLSVLTASAAGNDAVLLTTSPMPAGMVFTVLADGVLDTAQSPNPSTTGMNFVSGAALTALYLLDGAPPLAASADVIDATGSGHDGMAPDAAWSPDSSPGGVQSLHIDGFDDLVQAAPFDIAGASPSAAASFSLWFRADSFTVPDARLLSKATGVLTAEHYWMISTIQDLGVPKLRWRLKTGGVTETLIPAAAAIETNRWIHIAAVYDGAFMRLYQDGVLVAELAKTGSVDVDPTVSVALGNQPAGAANRPFHGNLDEVAIYARALTVDEIMQLAGLAPQAFPDAAEVDPGGSVTIDVLANDTAPQPGLAPDTVQVLVQPTHGAVTVDTNTGSIHYTHTGTGLVPRDHFQYRVSSLNGVLSNPVQVVVTINHVMCTPPFVEVSPNGADLCAGQPLALFVSASGSAPLEYQWRHNGVPIVGATSATFSIITSQTTDTGSYDVLVTNPCGGANSSAAQVTVLALPAITTPPASQSACSGDSVTLSVTASGTDLSYQWHHDSVPIAGATASTLVLDPITPAEGGSYEVAVTSSCGTVTSPPALVLVDAAPAVVVQPTSVAGCEGASVALSVLATGSGPLMYQWRRAGVEIPGANSTTLLFPALTLLDAEEYDVVVTNSCGSATSDTATVGVNPLPVFVNAPADQSICSGDSIFLVVSVTGASTYQWHKDGLAIPGATLSSYSVGNVSPADAGMYSVSVTGSCGSVASRGAVVSVNGGPTITTAPTPQVTCAGFAVQLSVIADDTNATYQWRRNGNNIPGANTSTYSIPSAAPSDAGEYDVVAMNSCGFSTSTAALLTIVPQADCDCNQNGLLDGDELTAGTAPDCNNNGVIDACDISAGSSMDVDLDGVPDECSTAFQRGDCNMDGGFDISDPARLLEFMFGGGSQPSCLDSCDANDDGMLDLADVIALLCGMFCSPAMPLPEPFTNCGVDPTEDALNCGNALCP